MSQIDWNKPIQIRPSMAGGQALPATVLEIDMGNRLVTWTGVVGKCWAFVHEDGRLIATLHNGLATSPGRQFVENADTHAELKKAIARTREHSCFANLEMADALGRVARAAEAWVSQQEAKKDTGLTPPNQGTGGRR